MSEGHIQVPPDSTGKKVRAIKRTVEGVEVYEEVFDLADIDLLLRTLLNTPLVRLAVDSAGRLRVIIDSSSLMGSITTLSAITTFPYGQSWELMQRANIEYNECQRSKFTFA